MSRPAGGWCRACAPPNEPEVGLSAPVPGTVNGKPAYVFREYRDTVLRRTDGYNRRPMIQLFRRKPISELVNEAQGLKRELGAGDLIMLAIGAVIGAGIFSSIGTAAAGETLPTGEVVRYGAGPALILSFILLGVVCGLAALCYAELAAMIPQAGSAYAYSYATLGELVAWIIGWDLILEYAVGNVAVAIAWSGYFVSLLSGFGI